MPDIDFSGCCQIAEGQGRRREHFFIVVTERLFAAQVKAGRPWRVLATDDRIAIIANGLLRGLHNFDRGSQ
ncbi:MAG: hypothetical protein H0T80_20165 [Betaproteobacteria bacterium]|nr:hypothetical protein [Betaproteobacteria bacterium]